MNINHFYMHVPCLKQRRNAIEAIANRNHRHPLSVQIGNFVYMSICGRYGHVEHIDMDLILFAIKLYIKSVYFRHIFE